MDFRIETFFNPHLAPGATRIDAVVVVTATGGEAPAGGGAAPRLTALLLDESGSMEGAKWERARQAADRCLAMVPDGDLVTVVTFSSTAQVVVPLTVLTPGSRADAARRLRQHRMAGNGTAMSTGLRAVGRQFATHPGALCYALLLTDGENDPADATDLSRAIEELRGRVEVDCRGVGTDWKPADLRLVAGALNGTADAVPDPERLEADFRACLARAIGKSTAGVRLRLWRPNSSRVGSVLQVTPERLALEGIPLDARQTDYALGNWGQEARDYHVSLVLDPAAVGEEVLACRPSVVWVEGGVERKATGSPVVATWTPDESLTTRINPEVAHATGQAEIATSIREGLEARERGDVAGATRLLGRAARLADASGNEEVTRRLSKVVDVVDASQGTVRLRRDAGKAEALELEMGGTRTVRRSRG